MLETVFAYLSNAFISAAIGIVVGWLTAQRFRDFIAGVPSGFRAAMNNVERNVQSRIANAMNDEFARYTPLQVKQAAPAVTATVTPPPPRVSFPAPPTPPQPVGAPTPPFPPVKG